ncbi:hypothetical protein HPB50_022819 [Hyalomma asiaticum]|uniref:Uncharacterized protein n=1 Tax=Hyalomma asiaticum TaxID=266040 RepID=A0ACB7TPX8_HYAAI|nr:hypothetical protein HPB50_022819 [Hyalomma asiaticum]
MTRASRDAPSAAKIPPPFPRVNPRSGAEERLLCREHQRRAPLGLVGQSDRKELAVEEPVSLCVYSVYARREHQRQVPLVSSDSQAAKSRHFRDEDYVPACRIRKLLPDAVPTVFEDCPSYLIPSAKKPRKDPAPRASFPPQTSRKRKAEANESELDVLCFVLHGTTSRYKIPCSYYFTKQLSGRDLFAWTKEVIAAVESCGFIIVRIVTDNYSANVTMFKLMGNGSLNTVVRHPHDTSRVIFLSFDPCHVLKNATCSSTRVEGRSAPELACWRCARDARPGGAGSGERQELDPMRRP